MTIGDLPDDIYEDSGCRLPLPRREDMDGEALNIFDLHLDTNGWSLAGLRGPGGIRLHSPRLSEAWQAKNRYLRREAGIPEPLRELVILVAAREMDSRFEWAAHEPEALRVGTAPEIIDVVKNRLPTDGLDAGPAPYRGLHQPGLQSRRSSRAYTRALATLRLRFRRSSGLGSGSLPGSGN